MSETFLTNCPHCKSVFKLRKEHLEIASGHVRCGSCHSLFLATDSLVSMDGEPIEQSKEALIEPSARPQDSGEMANPDEAILDSALNELVDAPELAMEQLESDPTEQAFKKGSWFKSIFYTFATILLLLAGLWYLYLWPNRMQLAQQSQWRPLLESSCALLKCQVPALQDIERFEISAIEVNEEIAGQQEVSLLLKNTASFAQPFPKMRIIMSDIKGGQFTTPIYTPAQYLPEVNHNTLITSGQTVQIGFSFLSDSKNYSGYQIELIK